MLYRLLATAAVALALSGPAFAGSTDTSAQAQAQTQAQTLAQTQTDQPAALDSEVQPVAPGTDDQSAAPATGAQPPAEPDTAAMPQSAPTGTGAPIIETQEADDWRAADVIGLAVATSSDETVGKVSDLLFAKDGNIRGVVLSIGGFLGVGSKLVALPWDAVAVDQELDLVTVRLSREELEAAPDFKTQEQVQAEQEALLRQKEQAEQLQQQQLQGMQPPAATE